MIFNEYLEEGKQFNKSLGSFEFNINSDGKDLLIKLTKDVKQIKEYGACTYFGYNFPENLDIELKRTALDFIKCSNDKDIEILINKAVMTLNNIINLAEFKTIIYLESSSPINSMIIDKISDISLCKLTPYQSVKELSKNLEFDYERYSSHLIKNGEAETDIKKSCEVVEIMMNSIHNLEHFEIVKYSNSIFSNFLKNFYNFKTSEQEKTFKELQRNKILIATDISSTLTSTAHILNTIRNMNSDCEIVVFSLIGSL